MKIQSRSIVVLLPLAFAASVCSSHASEPVAPTQSWGVKDLPKLATPSGLVNFTRDEIRSEELGLRHDLADLKAGKPKALVELSFAGARLAGASSGSVTAARIVYHFATLDAAARTERLDTALPRAIEQAPDRGLHRALRVGVHGALTGNWNVGSALAGEAEGQVVELVPAAVNSTHDLAHNISTDLTATK